ncbi:MAG: hypothetical protein QXH40_05930, partial [Candidatus Bathyarchaeia archaeon]
MNKTLVAVSLLPLVIGIALAFGIQETSIREGVIQEKFITPRPPQKLNPGNVTGWAFGLEGPKGIRLMLNISAEAEVRVIIGKHVGYDEGTGQIIWDKTKTIFNSTGTKFEENIPIEGEDVNYLAIKNEGSNPVEVYTHIKKIDYIHERKYPYLGLGTLTILLGGTILVYGLATTPRIRKRYHLRIGVKIARGAGFEPARPKR